MDHVVKSRLTKKDILTIPNLLSVIRILLIPVIVILYAREQLIAAVVIILLSGLTDVVDGKIARKFNMVSDFGKFLDPVADKLTQAALAVCLFSRYPAMIGLFLLMAVKEGLQFFWGLKALKATDNLDSSNWYGKVCTVLLYMVMIVLFLFPGIPAPLAYTLIGLCAAMLLLSMILYVRFFRSRFLCGQDPKTPDNT